MITCYLEASSRNSELVCDKLSQNVSKLGEKIPNIVHYIWFSTENKDLQYHHMLSILSADRLLQADQIYFHTNKEPIGPYWNQVRHLVTVIHREPTRILFGKPVKRPKYETSDSDVARVETIFQYGGIYSDLDVFFLRPMKEILHHKCVLGLESSYKVCSGVFL